MKELFEKREAAVKKMNDILEAAKNETRAMTEDEQREFDSLEAEIRALDATIEAENRARKIPEPPKAGEPGKKNDKEAKEEAEVRAFAEYVRATVAGVSVEQRAGEQNLDAGSNGAIIPVTIAKRIITEVKNICPILKKANIYSVKGTLKVPVWGKANSTHNITVGYQTEFKAITADAGKFTSVDLSGFLAGALTLIGQSVINNSDVDVVGFIVKQMAYEIAAWIEGELLKGTADKATGALSTTNTKETAATTAIAADELIDLQAKVPQVYQNEACWVMHPDTFTAIKKLKDQQQRYLLQDDYTSEFPYRLLGKPVFLSDNMPTIAASAKTVLYGDLTGLSVNFRENIQIQVLKEMYATQHAVGIVAWFEFDSKVTDNQKLAVLVQKNS